MSRSAKDQKIRQQLLGKQRVGRPLGGSASHPAPHQTDSRRKDEDAAGVLTRGILAAATAQPKNKVVGHDGEYKTIPGVSGLAGLTGALSLGTPITELVDEDGRVVRTPIAAMSGQTLTVQAGLTRTSRVLSAGARLVEIPPEMEAFEPDPLRTDRVPLPYPMPMFRKQTVSFSTVEPAAFELIDVDNEADPKALAYRQPGC